MKIKCQTFVKEEVLKIIVLKRGKCMYKMFPLLHFLSVIEVQVIYQCILFYFSVVLLDSSKFSNLKNWTAHINGQSDSNTGVSKARKIFKFSQTERQRMIN